MDLRDPELDVERRDDGSILLACKRELPSVPRSVPHLLERAVARHPDRPFMRQRGPEGAWEHITYADFERQANGVASWLAAQGFGEGDAVLILSGASIDHAAVAVGAQQVRVAAAPVSVGYSLLSQDHGKLRDCADLLGRRGRLVVFAENATAFKAAIEAVVDTVPSAIVLTSGEGPGEDLHALEANGEVDVASEMDRIVGETVARIMFTSGSTSRPKAVPTTQQALMAMVAQCEAIGLFDFPDDLVPQLLDAMPFSHIMAGNRNFNEALYLGATISLDEGKPAPALIQKTLDNLREVSPTHYVTAPAGYALLCDAMEADHDLRDAFFHELRYMIFGGAMLPVSVRDRLKALAQESVGRDIPVLAQYGATEDQLVASMFAENPRTEIIGLPVPGCTVKLAPVGDKLELRVKGPNVMPEPGYLDHPNEETFDEEGYFRSGDAVRLADDDDPPAGLVFDGRLAEEFKLANGTWVAASPLRSLVLDTAAPLVSELVPLGLNQDAVGALVWVSADAVAREVGEDADASAVRAAVAQRLAEHNAAHPGSSRRIARALICTDPLSYDESEVTEKGTVNMRRVGERRATDAGRLFASDPAPDVIVL